MTNPRRNDYCRPQWLSMAILSALVFVLGAVASFMINLESLEVGSIDFIFFLVPIAAAVIGFAAALAGIVGAKYQERSVSFLASLFALLAAAIYPILQWLIIFHGKNFETLFILDFDVQGELFLTLKQFGAYAALLGLILGIIALSVRYRANKSMVILSLISTVFLWAAAGVLIADFLIEFDPSSYSDAFEVVKYAVSHAGFIFPAIFIGAGNMFLAMRWDDPEKKKEEEPRLNLDGEEEDKDVIVVE
ncbi:MAG: hypothetical protein K6F32_02085 [Bacilli bacterium]|nr:hypothetical protein [Bacilli bacterium]